MTISIQLRRYRHPPSISTIGVNLQIPFQRTTFFPMPIQWHLAISTCTSPTDIIFSKLLFSSFLSITVLFYIRRIFFNPRQERLIIEYNPNSHVFLSLSSPLFEHVFCSLFFLKIRAILDSNGWEGFHLKHFSLLYLPSCHSFLAICTTHRESIPLMEFTLT